MNKLINEGLLQELAAKEDMPVWRRDEDNRAYSLRIAKAGLQVIAVEEAQARADDPAAKNFSCDRDCTSCPMDG